MNWKETIQFMKDHEYRGLEVIEKRLEKIERHIFTTPQATPPGGRIVIDLLDGDAVAIKYEDPRGFSRDRELVTLKDAGYWFMPFCNGRQIVVVVKDPAQLFELAKYFETCPVEKQE